MLERGGGCAGRLQRVIAAAPAASIITAPRQARTLLGGCEGRRRRGRCRELEGRRQSGCGGRRRRLVNGRRAAQRRAACKRGGVCLWGWPLPKLAHSAVILALQGSIGSACRDRRRGRAMRGLAALVLALLAGRAAGLEPHEDVTITKGAPEAAPLPPPPLPLLPPLCQTLPAPQGVCDARTRPGGAARSSSSPRCPLAGSSTTCGGTATLRRRVGGRVGESSAAAALPAPANAPPTSPHTPAPPTKPRHRARAWPVLCCV